MQDNGVGRGYVPKHSARKSGRSGYVPQHRKRAIPGNGRPRGRRIGAGALGAALLGAGPAGFLVAPPVAALPTSAVAPAPLGVAASGASAPANQGYDLVGADGGVFNFRTPFFGSESDHHLAAPMTAAAATPDGRGYWLAAGDGGVFAFGSARFHGSLSRVRLNQSIVAMAATAGGGGYVLLGADGGVFAFGHARYWGNAVGLTRAPAVGIALTPDGGGYWIVESDGTVWSFGDAPVLRSRVTVTAGRSSVDTFSLFRPASGIAPTPDGKGYWIVARDGGVFAYGDAPFFGSKGRTGVAPSTVVGLLPTPSGRGYWLAGSDGNVYPFGDAAPLGTLLGKRLGGPIVAITGRLFGPAVSGVLPAGVINESYSAQLFASGGAPPYTFALTGLPPGLSVNAGTGKITGTPTEVGHFSVTATVTDAGGRHATKVLSLTIEFPPITVSYARPLYIGVTTDAAQGGLGDDTPTIAGGDGGPFTASLVAGSSLLPGLRLESDGTLRGDAAAPGTFDLKVTDSHGDSVAVPFSVGFAPTGDIATVAGGSSSTDQNGTEFGQTTLPPADAQTVAPAAAFPDGNGDTGPSTGAQVLASKGVAVEPDGTTFISEVAQNAEGTRNGNGDVRMISPGGIISTFAGGGTTASPDGVPATDAVLTDPQYVGTDSAGDVFIGDLTGPGVIYEIPKTSGLHHGNTTAWTAGDIYPIVGVGQAESTIGSLAGMAVAPDGTVYWSDSSSNTINSLGPNASTGNSIVSSDTPTGGGSEALGTPGVLAVDPANGILYLANHCSSCDPTNPGPVAFSAVERIDPNAASELTDIAPSFRFDVSGLAVDSLHNVYISDIHGINGVGAKTDDDQVLRVTPASGVPLVVAGALPTAAPLTTAGFANGVPATSTGIDSPNGIAYNPSTGNLTIAQTPATGLAGMAAKGVRIVSGVEHVAGETYTPGPMANVPI